MSSRHLFEDQTGHTIEDYPGEVDNCYFLGINDWGGWYFNPATNAIKNYELKGNGNGPLELTPGFLLDEEEAKEEYEDISELCRELVDKTILGHAFILAEELANKTHFSKNQAEVFALRDVYNIGRTECANVLNKSANTIDNQRTSARKKAKQAQNYLKLVSKYQMKKKETKEDD